MLQKARHRDSDPAAALANFFKALYFRRGETWMLHTLDIDASCFKISFLSYLVFCKKGGEFLSSLQLLLQKARHRNSDPAAVLAHFLKAIYFRRWKTWMLHILYIDASCYEVSVSHMSIVLDLIFMVQ